MIVGCYTMHLYCDGPGPHNCGIVPMEELTGQTERACFTEARKRGWQIDKQEQKAYCPKCRRGEQ